MGPSVKDGETPGRLETWHMEPDYEKGRSFGLVTAYGRCAGNGKSVCWAEYGVRVGLHGGTEETHREQARMAETMVRVIRNSGADRVAIWWWPGGWRDHGPAAGARPRRVRRALAAAHGPGERRRSG